MMPSVAAVAEEVVSELCETLPELVVVAEEVVVEAVEVGWRAAPAAGMTR